MLQTCYRLLSDTMGLQSCYGGSYGKDGVIDFGLKMVWLSAGFLHNVSVAGTAEHCEVDRRDEGRGITSRWC